jgi:carboxypeptidase D
LTPKQPTTPSLNDVTPGSIGKSVRGADLFVLEISDKPGVEEPEPNFRAVANMHGDETSGR